MLKEEKKKTKKTYSRYSKTVRNGDIETSVEVEEVDNGYIISYSKYDHKNGWKELERKRLISAENPLSEEDKKEDDALSLIKAIKDLNLK